MTLAVSRATLPVRKLAGVKTGHEWVLAIDDGSIEGAPEDVSDVTDGRATAEKLVADDETAPDPIVWPWGAGLSIVTAVGGPDDGFPVLTLVTDDAGIPAGTWRIKVSLVRGLVDWPVEDVFEMIEQPA